MKKPADNPVLGAASLVMEWLNCLAQKIIRVIGINDRRSKMNPSKAPL